MTADARVVVQNRPDLLDGWLMARSKSTKVAPGQIVVAQLLRVISSPDGLRGMPGS